MWGLPIARPGKYCDECGVNLRKVPHFAVDDGRKNLCYVCYFRNRVAQLKAGFPEPLKKIRHYERCFDCDHGHWRHQQAAPAPRNTGQERYRDPLSDYDLTKNDFLGKPTGVPCQDGKGIDPLRKPTGAYEKDCNGRNPTRTPTGVPGQDGKGSDPLRKPTGAYEKDDKGSDPLRKPTSAYEKDDKGSDPIGKPTGVPGQEVKRKPKLKVQTVEVTQRPVSQPTGPVNNPTKLEVKDEVPSPFFGGFAQKPPNKSEAVPVKTTIVDTNPPSSNKSDAKNGSVSKPVNDSTKPTGVSGKEGPGRSPLKVQTVEVTQRPISQPTRQAINPTNEKVPSPVSGFGLVQKPPNRSEAVPIKTTNVATKVPTKSFIENKASLNASIIHACDSGAASCSLCGEEFKRPRITMVVKLDCGHVMHRECLCQHILTPSNKCPLCSSPIISLV